MQDEDTTPRHFPLTNAAILFIAGIVGATVGLWAMWAYSFSQQDGGNGFIMYGLWAVFVAVCMLATYGVLRLLGR